MDAKALNVPLPQLYEQDLAEWSNQTVELLRDSRFEELDIEHLIEQIEDMPKSARRELRSRMRLIIVHLLKWTQQSEKRSRSWRATLTTQRAELRTLLQESPSLRRIVPQSLDEVYSDSIKQAVAETGLPRDAFPAECPFSPAEILDPDYLPD